MTEYDESSHIAEAYTASRDFYWITRRILHSDFVLAHFKATQADVDAPISVAWAIESTDENDVLEESELEVVWQTADNMLETAYEEARRAGIIRASIVRESGEPTRRTLTMERGVFASGEHFFLQEFSVFDDVPRSIVALEVDDKEITEVFIKYDFFGEDRFSYTIVPSQENEEYTRFSEDMILLFTRIGAQADAIAILEAMLLPNLDDFDQRLDAVHSRFSNSAYRPEVEGFLDIARTLKQRFSERQAVAADHTGLVLPPMDRLLRVARDLNDYFKAKRQEILRDPEWITKQLAASIKAYTLAAEQLSTTDPDMLIADEATIRAEFKAWFTPEKFAIINNLMQTNEDMKLQLVITPNVEADIVQIGGLMQALAQKCGQELLPLPVDFFDQYTPQELSGSTAEATHVRFCMFPRGALTISGTAEQRRSLLQQMQQQFPDVDEPSILETVMWWHNLMSHGFIEKGHDLFFLTPTYYCKLPPLEHISDGELVHCVPASAFLGKGKPGLAYDPASNIRRDILCVR